MTDSGGKELALSLLKSLYSPSGQEKIAVALGRPIPKAEPTISPFSFEPLVDPDLPPLPESYSYTNNVSPEQQKWMDKIKGDVVEANFGSFQEYFVTNGGGTRTMDQTSKGDRFINQVWGFMGHTSRLRGSFPEIADYRESSWEKTGARIYAGAYESNGVPIVLGLGRYYRDFVGRPNYNAFALSFKTPEAARDFMAQLKIKPRRALEFYFQTTLGGLPTPSDAVRAKATSPHNYFRSPFAPFEPVDVPIRVKTIDTLQATSQPQVTPAKPSIEDTQPRQSKPPPTQESQQQTPPELHPDEIRKLVQENCIAAEYNVFQLVDSQVERTQNGEFKVRGKPTYGAAADSHRVTDRFMQRFVNYQALESLEKRFSAVSDLYSGHFRDTHPNDGQVGVAIIGLFDGKDDTENLVFYGAISSEIMGTWRGGRTNRNNSLVFQFRKGTIDKLMQSIDIRARDYSDGTRNNFQIIDEIVRTVFPSEALQRFRNNFYRRQEVQAVVDKRVPH